MSAIEDIPQRVCDALRKGKLDASDLTARRLSAFAGKTTSVLYHHWGSLDGFLYAVSQEGVQLLGARLLAEIGGARGLIGAAESFVRFGVDHPALYELMFVRPFDWDALRASGQTASSPGVGLWSQLVSYFAGGGSKRPDMDARLMFAGLHGLVHLASTGRANVGAMSVSDRDTAIEAARVLAQRFMPATQKEE